MVSQVTGDRTVTEQTLLGEIKLREQMLSDREAKIAREREQNQVLFSAIDRLRSEHEEERHRLRDEHARLRSMQTDLSSESAVLREQLVLEREAMSVERKRVAQDRQAWETQKAREEKELHGHKEMIERTRLNITEQLAESEQERANMMRQLGRRLTGTSADGDVGCVRCGGTDAERIDMRHLKQQLLAAKAKLTADETKLHADEEELQTHMKYMKQRMENLALLGDQVCVS